MFKPINAAELRQFILTRYAGFLVDGGSPKTASACHDIARKLARLTGRTMESTMNDLADDAAVMMV